MRQSKYQGKSQNNGGKPQKEVLVYRNTGLLSDDKPIGIAASKRIESEKVVAE